MTNFKVGLKCKIKVTWAMERSSTRATGGLNGPLSSQIMGQLPGECKSKGIPSVRDTLLIFLLCI
jgi:hypothetical protein